MRTEKDSLGARDLPDDALYGSHTARSLENFGAFGGRLPLEIIHAMVRLKWACARANGELKTIPAERVDAIVSACRRVLDGECDAQFPVSVFQAGSGTSSHMNVNEVLARIAGEELGARRGDHARVHPNDDVNCGQSTNNIFPSAIRLAAVGLCGGLLDALDALVAALRAKEAEFGDVLKSGRTHLQDAVPLTLGQEFGAYARALEKDGQRILAARGKLHELGVGGNAVGTGINTKPEFRALIIRELNALTGGAFRAAEDGIEATQFLTDIAEMSAMLRLLASDLNKIANDLRLLSSGPRTGFGELALPAVEPGSSIMPGKVNPGICEAVNMACIQVFGHDHAVAHACGAGQLELNTHMPLIGFNLVESLRLLAAACRVFAGKCVAGIRADRDRCAAHFEGSAGIATVLNPRLGYDRVAELVKESVRTGKNLRELVLERKIMTAAEWDDLTRNSTRPNL